MKPSSSFSRLFVALGSAALLGTVVALQGATAPAPVNALPNTPQQPTEISSNKWSMKSTDKETTTTFDGNVLVTATGMRMSCDHLVVVSTRVGDKDDTIGKQDRFRSLVATGSVRIRQGEREATCGKAVVLPRENKITLTENPVVIDHGSDVVATGDEIVMHRGEREVTGTNLKVTAPELRNLGFDPKQPPKGAPANATDAANPATGATATPAPTSPAAPVTTPANAPASTPPPVTVPGLQKPDSTK